MAGFRGTGWFITIYAVAEVARPITAVRKVAECIFIRIEVGFLLKNDGRSLGPANEENDSDVSERQCVLVKY